MAYLIDRILYKIKDFYFLIPLCKLKKFPKSGIWNLIYLCSMKNYKELYHLWNSSLITVSLISWSSKKLQDFAFLTVLIFSKADLINGKQEVYNYKEEWYFFSCSTNLSEFAGFKSICQGKMHLH